MIRTCTVCMPRQAKIGHTSGALAIEACDRLVLAYSTYALSFPKAYEELGSTIPRPENCVSLFSSFTVARRGFR